MTTSNKDKQISMAIFSLVLLILWLAIRFLVNPSSWDTREFADRMVRAGSIEYVDNGQPVEARIRYEREAPVEFDFIKYALMIPASNTVGVLVGIFAAVSWSILLFTPEKRRYI